MEQNMEKLIEENKKLREEVAYLKEQLELFKRLLLGKKKETLSSVSDGQLSLFDSAEEDAGLPEGIIAEQTTTVVKGHQRAKKRYRIKDVLSQYPVEEVHHYLEGEACQCPECCQTMKDFGQASFSDEVIFIPEQIKIKRHIQHSYVCSNYEAHDNDVFKKSELPNKPLQQSLASASMVTEVMSQKFEYFVPLNRQEKRWHRLGLPLNRRTLSQWVITTSERFLAPLFDMLHDKLLSETVLHADETPVQALASEKSNNYCWLTRTVSESKCPIVLYHYDESRSESVIENILPGFKGYLHCDGYSAYSNLEGITPVRCLAHIRRRFYDSQSNHETKGLAYEAITYCDKMFEVERQLKAKKFDKPSAIIAYRKKHLAPLFKQFQIWLDNHNALAKSALGVAINYAKKFFPSLQCMIEHPQLALSNNIAERSLRQIALGRKNWLFSQSFRGAQANLVCMSIIQTAIENGLDAWKYLNYLFTELPNLPVLNKESLAAYLPWSPEVKAQCS